MTYQAKLQNGGLTNSELVDLHWQLDRLDHTFINGQWVEGKATLADAARVFDELEAE